MNVLRALPALLAAALLLPALASAQQPAPGAYVTEGGWGTLTIQDGGFFSLESAGANAHNCSLEGQIVHGRAVLQEGCVVRFRPKGRGILVERAQGDTADTCGDYCGMRAGFQGEYVPERPACRDAEVQAERAAFLVDYKARRYQPAASRLEKLVGACGRFLWWMTDVEVRNDLAIAQYRAGRPAACLATLKPLERLVGDDAHFPPMEKDWADGVVPQIRFNWTLCGGTPPASGHGQR